MVAVNSNSRLSFALREVRLGAAAALLVGDSVQTAHADESGVSFWLPGQFGSLAAVPQTPGWSLGTVYYHTSVGGSGAVAAAREIQIGRIPATVNVSLNASLNAHADLLILAPTYTFGTPVLGGQLAAGVTGIFGRNAVGVDGTLTANVGPFGAFRTGSISDSLTSVGDLYPMVTLKWNDGVHNWMTYATGDVPVGAYDPTRLANIGIGHGAIDGGGGYTYLNPAAGQEFSGVAGFTYNFKNRTHSIKAASISISTGAHPSFSRSRPSWVSSDMFTSRSPTIPVSIRSWAASGRGSLVWVPSSTTCSRSATCRDI